MPQGEQVRNGKAFEYALAQQYATFIKEQGRAYDIKDGFDYAKQLIWYRGKKYPFCEIEEVQGQNSNWHIVSTEDLNTALYDDKLGYTSENAQWIDERITYFVSTKRDLLKPAEKLLKEIYG